MIKRPYKQLIPPRIMSIVEASWKKEIIFQETEMHFYVLQHVQQVKINVHTQAFILPPRRVLRF